MENEWILSPDRHIYYNTWGKIHEGGGEKLIVGGFDMDNTLIHTKSGKIHPVNKDDWKWLPKIGFEAILCLLNCYTGYSHICKGAKEDQNTKY